MIQRYDIDGDIWCKSAAPSEIMVKYSSGDYVLFSDHEADKAAARAADKATIKQLVEALEKCRWRLAPNTPNKVDPNDAKAFYLADAALAAVKGDPHD